MRYFFYLVAHVVQEPTQKMEQRFVCNVVLGSFQIFPKLLHVNSVPVEAHLYGDKNVV